MMYCEFGRSFNEHTKRSETERGSDVEGQMSEVENGCIRKTVGNFYKKNVQT